MKSIGLLIPTLNSRNQLRISLPLILSSNLKTKNLIIDSSSTDGTVQFAKEYGVETLVIPRSEFNHGLTREMGRKYLQTDIIIMMTPDAYLLDNNSLSTLVEPIINHKASISYGRQIPHLSSDFFEAFPRLYNYPAYSHVRGIDDWTTYGSYTFFCSNSFSAYSNSALDEIGGFPKVKFGEDAVVTAMLLNKRHKIAYVSEAIVRHSHKYTLSQEFKRHFEMGQARQQFKTLLKSKEDQKRGVGFARSMLVELSRKQPQLIPYAFLHLCSKWLGYQYGKLIGSCKK